jgi:hypothetical protein
MLNDVTCFEIPLTVPVGCKPPRRHVVNLVGGEERIVVSLGDLMAERSDVEAEKKLSDG